MSGNKHDNKTDTHYSEAKQKLLLEVLLSSEDIFSCCQNILDEKYFSNSLRPAVRYLINYASKYNAIPKIEQVIAETEISLSKVDNISLHHRHAFLEEIETFCRTRALVNTILEAPDLIEKGLYGEIEKRVKDSILISLQSNLGTDYFADPKSRLLRIKDNNGQVSTGWPLVDDKLYGGVNPGELTIWCAGSGVGKSLFLQNLSVNFSLNGLNVVYITLELSEELCSMRMDSIISGINSREIFKKLDEVELKVKQVSKKSGSFHIKQMPQGSTVNDIKAYLKNYEIQTGKKPDALVVDYLDLLFPNNKKIDPSNLFIKDKFVTEELRGLLVEYKMIGQTAAQLNRGSVQEQEHNHSHISGGISKIQTADNVISIFGSDAMKERGQYQIQFLKTRSSSGVGSKVNLEFDPSSLKITSEDSARTSIVDLKGTTAEKFTNSLKRTSSNVAPDQTSIPNTKDIAKKNLDSLKSLTSLLRK